MMDVMVRFLKYITIHCCQWKLDVSILQGNIALILFYPEKSTDLIIWLIIWENKAY